MFLTQTLFVLNLKQFLHLLLSGQRYNILQIKSYHAKKC